MSKFFHKQFKYREVVVYLFLLGCTSIYRPLRYLLRSIVNDSNNMENVSALKPGLLITKQDRLGPLDKGQLIKAIDVNKKSDSIDIRYSVVPVL